MADVHSTVLPFHVHYLVIVLPTGAYRFEYAAIGPRCWYAHCETTGERTTCYNEQFCREWCADRAQALDAEARQPEPPAPAVAAALPLLPARAESAQAAARLARRRAMVAAYSAGHVLQAGAPILLHSMTESGALARFIQRMQWAMPVQIQSILDAEREAAGELKHDGDERIEAMRRRLWASDAWLESRREAVRYLRAFGLTMDVNDNIWNPTERRIQHDMLSRARRLAEGARAQARAA